MVWQDVLFAKQQVSQSPEFHAGNEKVNDTIRGIAKEEGVPLADIDGAVPKTLEYLLDDVHSTSKGARVAAETVANTIVKAGYLK